MKAFEELWTIACIYGRPSLYRNREGEVRARIELNTIAHVELKAQSELITTSPNEALQSAIDKAVEIVNSMEKQVQQFKQIGKSDGKSSST